MNGISHELYPETNGVCNGDVTMDSAEDGEEREVSSTISEDGSMRKASHDSHDLHADNGLSIIYSLPSPRPLCLESGRRRKLVLHLDIRNTILVADSVGSVNVEQALNSFLSSVFWGRETEDGWQWLSDNPSLKPFAPDALSYYKHLEHEIVKVPADRETLRKRTSYFTDEEFGRRFRPYFEKHLAMMKWGHKYVASRDANLIMRGSDNQPYHYILPSVYRLLHYLHATNRDFAVVIRTYGLDTANVLNSLAVGLKGKHPDFRKPIRMPIHRVPGKIHRSGEGGILLEVMKSEGEVQERIGFPRDIYRHLSSTRGVVGFKDDFPFWQKNKYNYAASKPLWIDLNDDSVHHIFFDDNFRPNEEDSIVDVLEFEGPHDQTPRRLSMEEVAELEDVCLVQADLLESTHNADYFIEKVRLCEQNYSQLLKGQVMSSPR